MLGATPAAYALLQSYGWPGNVRELRNVIERAMLLSDSDRLDARDFPAMTKAVSAGNEFELPAAGVDLEQLERSLLVQALRRSRGNQTRAGTLLGLNRDQIRYRIEKFGLSLAPKPTDPSRRCMTNDLATIDVVVRDGSRVCLRRAVHEDVPALVGSSSRSRTRPLPAFPRVAETRGRRVHDLAAAEGGQGTALVVNPAAGSSRSPASIATAEPGRPRGGRVRGVRCTAGGRHRHAAPRAAGGDRRAQGIDMFDAEMLGDNRRMLDVFRDSGFGVRTTVERGVCTSCCRSGDRAVRRKAAARSRTAATASMRPSSNRGPSRWSAPTASAARSAPKSSTT